MITFKKLREACWSGFKQVGMKKKGKKFVPNCVPEEDQKEDAPANAAGGGGVAGIGVGADGEPGIRPDAAKKYKKKNICISGVITTFNNKPQIQIDFENQMLIESHN